MTMSAKKLVGNDCGTDLWLIAYLPDHNGFSDRQYVLHHSTHNEKMVVMEIDKDYFEFIRFYS